MDEILRAVKALQTADKYGVAMPAGWPQNELIGNKVLIPAPADEKTAKERAKMYDNYDWCYAIKTSKSDICGSDCIDPGSSEKAGYDKPRIK